MMEEKPCPGISFDHSVEEKKRCPECQWEVPPTHYPFEELIWPLVDQLDLKMQVGEEWRVNEDERREIREKHLSDLACQRGEVVEIADVGDKKEGEEVAVFGDKEKVVELQ